MNSKEFLEYAEESCIANANAWKKYLKKESKMKKLKSTHRVFMFNEENHCPKCCQKTIFAVVLS